MTEEARAVAANLVDALRGFGEAREDGQIQDSLGLRIISSGIAYAVFNSAVITSEVDDPKELEDRIALAASFFRVLHHPWTLWFCNDHIGKKARRGFSGLTSRYRLEPLIETPGMFAERLTPPERILPQLDIKPVGDEPTRLAFARLIGISFDTPFEVCQAIYDRERAWRGNYRAWLGYLGSEAVTTAAIVNAADVTGIYSVATLPEFRQRGYGETVMRYALAEAARDGEAPLVLQSSRAGFALYRRMGFKKVTGFEVYIHRDIE
ncbi:MAG: GNAT family N-acetyltransferase [Bryobacteraceae bacterium]